MYLCNSCAWFDESQHQKIIDNYEIGWNDIESNRAISKRIKDYDGYYEIIISDYVYAVGHNEKYIIAKQSQNFNAATNYYLIDIEKNKMNSAKGIFGPLNEPEFEKIKKDLKIQNLKFDLNYDQKPEN